MALVVALGWHLLGTRHNGFGAIDLDDYRACLDALDDTVDDLALALGELVEDQPPLGIAQLLHHHLLGGLGGDAAELGRRDILVDLIAGLGVGEQHLPFRTLQRASLLEDDQVRVVLDVVRDVLDDGQPVVDVRLTRIGIDFGSDETAVFLMLFVGRDEGLLDSLHDHLAWHAFLRSELGDGSHEFTFHVWHALRSTSKFVSAARSLQQKKWGLPTS